MADYKPYYTSADLIDAVKRKISFPTFQATFTDQEILKFANEEMFISQVPSIIEFHESYFVYRVDVPLVNNISKYDIPSRAIGMRLRDVMYVDSSNNLYEMTRIEDGDQAYFQRNIGSNESIHKYFLENNQVCLAPSVTTGATGSLAFFIFLRPNQLVLNQRAAICQSFSKDISFNNSLITDQDQILIQRYINTASPENISLKAVTTTLVSGTPGNPTELTVSSPHGYDVGETFNVYITENTGTTPAINGIYTGTSTGTSTFTIPVTTSAVGSNGNIAFDYQFSKGSSSTQTALNFSNTLNRMNSEIATNNNSSSTARLTQDDISLTVDLILTNNNAITKNDDITIINYDQVSTTFQDPDTGIISNLFQINSKIDFLQTNPGHRTYIYDIKIRDIQGNSVTFKTSDLMVYRSNGSDAQKTILDFKVGDYISLANESIIPQIPPDMHNVLAERTSARILASIGDVAGLQSAETMINRMEKNQGTLLDNRVENSPSKVLNRHSLLRLGKFNGSKRHI